MSDSCGYSNTGNITQLVKQDLAPTLSVSTTVSGKTVYADPSATTDDDSGVPNPTGPYYYEWNWGDGNWSDSYAYSNGGLASHAYASPGTSTITVYAYDTAYNRTSTTRTIDIVNVVHPPRTFRIEDTNRAIRYHGSWATRPCRHVGCSHNGTEKASTTRGDRAVVHFTGTGIAWKASKGPRGGKARVYIDGVLRGKVNLYRARVLSGVAVYTSPALPRGPHTLGVKLIRNKRINIDAFRVTR